MVWLNHTYYLLLKSEAKFSKLSPPVKIPANYTNSVQFAHTVREFSKIRTFFKTYSTLCFRHMPQQRTLRNSSELRKFHAVRPHSPRITRNLHHLLTLHVRFRCLTSGRQLLKIPASQAKSAQFSHLSCELRELCAFHTKLIHIQFTSFRSLTIDREPRKIGVNQPDFQLPQIMRNLLNPHHDQQTRSQPRELHKCTANDANSASFTQCMGK